jgi:LPXTG-site transpeptidase (sortase) family protein
VVVPRLGLDVRVVPIVAVDGVLEPPSDPQVLGWWQDGAEPGALRGGAVITGHTVHTGGGALDNLRSLHIGDDILVDTANGTIRYAVARVVNMTKQAVATRSAALFDGEVPGRLVLITCTNWDGVEYLANTVVIAAPVGAG